MINYIIFIYFSLILICTWLTSCEGVGRYYKTGLKTKWYFTCTTYCNFSTAASIIFAGYDLKLLSSLKSEVCSVPTVNERMIPLEKYGCFHCNDIAVDNLSTTVRFATGPGAKNENCNIQNK